MSVEDGTPPNAPPSELASVKKLSVKKWLIALSVVGIAVGLLLYFFLPREQAVLLITTKTMGCSDGGCETGVPMVIRFNGESHNECIFRAIFHK